MTEYPTHPMVIRRKAVVVRELPPGSPEIIGDPVEIRSAEPPPAIAEALRSKDPVVDPTHLGKRRRRHSHVRQYRLAQIFTALSMLCSGAGIICLLLGDRIASHLVLAAAALLGTLALLLCWRNPLTGRVLGYAVAATVLATIAVGASVAAPAQWFEEPDNDILEPRVQRVKAR